ncbi:Choline/ethanolaminephosphotransferase 1 [Operophtera brumata]|uniref:Choline/ethanolaminephosphotransferase 1 n=1 Tax=Operophtera brumata TaxID=104452 RepID=A0A0L7L785_OPEBR|nr:Choline/ethanolaminephosphotransferase 1 [Operophtera brumata]
MGRIDVTEAQYSIILIHMLSAILGSDFWGTQVSGGVEWRHSLALCAVGGAVLSGATLASAIGCGGVGKNGSTVAISGLSVPWSLLVSSMCNGLQVFFILNFGSTFRVRGCGKNGSTVALPTINISLNLLSNYAVVVFTIYLIVGYVTVIMRGGVGKNGSTVASQVHRSPPQGTSILSPVIPFSLVVVPAFIIFQKSESQVYENHPALYILAFGMVAAKVTNRLVVAHMTKSEMEYYDWSLLGPAMLFLNQYFNNAVPEYLICLEICDHLKIRLFRIPYPPASPALAGAKPNDRNGTNARRNTQRQAKRQHSQA